jgi:hypothetical protein
MRTFSLSTRNMRITFGFSKWMRRISLVQGGRLPQVCSEFKAMNRALNDGAQEADLSCWSFRVRQMTPIPQCPNCRVTVDRNTVARVWTG